MVNSVDRMTDSPFVFTTTGRTSISGFSDGKERLDAVMLEIARAEAVERGNDPDAVTIAPWRIHDLRRTVASGMARLGIGVAVAEKVMNHVSGTSLGLSAFISGTISWLRNDTLSTFGRITLPD